MNKDKSLLDTIVYRQMLPIPWILKLYQTSVLFPLCRLGRNSEPCKEEILLFRSWYTLPRSRNLKFIFELKTPLAQSSSAGTSELFPFAPTRIYVGIINYVGIVPLAPRNYLLLAPTCISLENKNLQRFLLWYSSLIFLAPRN